MLHFEIQEFSCPSHPNSGINMDNAFLQMLDDARGIAGIPFKITSGYRSVEHNQMKWWEVYQTQATLLEKPADIAVGSGNERYIIINALIKAGFRRLGVAKTFIHCDNDESKNNSIWTY